MAITISGTNGIVGAGFTVDNSGVSVTAGIGTFSSIQGSGANLTALPAANLTGTLPAISGANLTGIAAGITEADFFKLTADLSLSANTLTLLSSNWARPTAANDGFSTLGTGMSESSGVWTFPSTGFYLVTQRMTWYANGSNSTNESFIYSTEDGSTYGYQTQTHQSITNGSFANSFGQALIDVTSVSDVKLKFYAKASGANQLGGANSASSLSYVSFIRLADT